VDCLNGGKCTDGKCVCTDGYSGTYCTGNKNKESEKLMDAAIAVYKRAGSLIQGVVDKYTTANTDATTIKPTTVVQVDLNISTLQAVIEGIKSDKLSIIEFNDSIELYKKQIQNIFVNTNQPLQITQVEKINGWALVNKIANINIIIIKLQNLFPALETQKSYLKNAKDAEKLMDAAIAVYKRAGSLIQSVVDKYNIANTDATTIKPTTVAQADLNISALQATIDGIKSDKISLIEFNDSIDSYKKQIQNIFVNTNQPLQITQVEEINGWELESRIVTIYAMISKLQNLFPALETYKSYLKNVDSVVDASWVEWPDGSYSNIYTEVVTGFGDYKKKTILEDARATTRYEADNPMEARYATYMGAFDGSRNITRIFKRYDTTPGIAIPIIHPMLRSTAFYNWYEGTFIQKPGKK
jgi:FlaG/FlaF family flagellin (archaellin)